MLASPGVHVARLSITFKHGVSVAPRPLQFRVTLHESDYFERYINVIV